MRAASIGDSRDFCMPAQLLFPIFSLIPVRSVAASSYFCELFSDLHPQRRALLCLVAP